jgi:hypothetical protein
MRSSWKFVTLSITALVATAALLAGAATAASVTPTVVVGNINVEKSGNNYGCVDFVTAGTAFVGSQTSAPVADGQSQYTGTTPNNSSYTLTVNQTGGNTIDFSITGGTVLVAAVKAGDSFNVYDYQPGGTTSDTGLTGPDSSQRISHYVFCIGDPIVTAVAFRSGSAVRSGHAVVVHWKTASEAGTLGYNVYRLVNGKLVRANKHLILTHGGSYSFTDRKAPTAKSLRYRIQAVHTDGSRSWYGPLAVKASA